jgi:hypothetical protein
VIAFTWWGVSIGVLVVCAWLAAAFVLMIAAVERHPAWWVALAVYLAVTVGAAVWVDGRFFDDGLSEGDQCVATGGTWVDTGRNKTVLVGKTIVVRSIYACVAVEGLP